MACFAFWPTSAWRTGAVLAVGSSLLVSLALLVGWLNLKRREEPAAPGEKSVAYNNLRPKVRYVGDSACAPCHPQIVESYHRHPMSRDLSLVTGQTLPEPLSKESHNPFEKGGMTFHVQRQGREVLHEVLGHDPKGQLALLRSDSIQFAIGSGKRGRSYIINRDGYLFQSAISWYAQSSVWDLSPGFSLSLLAGLSVQPKCLFCHCNRAEPLPNTVNRYVRPIQNATAIGCERCHGPGELHVERQQQGDAEDSLDDTIVNPARLEPALREAVCQQCHLTTAWAVVRRGREPFDYRPGLRLQDYWSAFVQPPKLAQDYRHASRVEQLAVSRCFQASQGKLGCISCHDPHVHTPAEEKVSFYRGRCLRCHQEQSCGLPLASRRKETPEDSCVVCHMPRVGSRKGVHVTDTDHRIRRRTDATAPREPRTVQTGEPLLIPFHHGLPGPSQDEVGRDLGLALVEVAKATPALREHASLLALPLLQVAVARWPDDPASWQARGKAKAYLGHLRDGLDDLKAALARAPRRETALEHAAELASTLGDGKSALEFWRRLITVDPWSATAHTRIAQWLVRDRDWPQALQACKAALALDPTQLDARTFLVSCLIQMGQAEQARAEFAALMALEPPREEELRRWFAEQLPASR